MVIGKLDPHYKGKWSHISNHVRFVYVLHYLLLRYNNWVLLSSNEIQERTVNFKNEYDYNVEKNKKSEYFDKK